MEASVNRQFYPRKECQRAEPINGRSGIAQLLHLGVSVLETIYPSGAVVVSYRNTVNLRGHESKQPFVRGEIHTVPSPVRIG